MSREWKPGEVAILTVRELTGTAQHVGLCYEGGTVRGHDVSDGVARWVLPDHSEVWSSVNEARPLVVIDPEDREAVERLVRHDGYLGDWASDEDVADMQVALREFANLKPTKPDEPTGLGAVVEDADGKRWLAVGESCVARGPHRWARDGRVTGEWHMYSDISAVRVLSEGVQP